MGKRWEEWEVEVLKDCYGKINNKYIAMILKDRSVIAITLEGGKLNLNSDRKDCIAWNNTELDNLRKYYKVVSREEMMEIVSNRTWEAIMRKASNIGIAFQQIWTKEEDEILKNTYLKEERETIVGLLPRWEWNKIQKRASAIECARGNRNKFDIIDNNKAKIYLENKYNKIIAETIVDMDKLEDILNCGRWGITNKYASTRINNKQVRLHSFVLGIEDGTMVDHIDRNPLNNLLSNLRVTDKRGNAENISTQRNTPTGERDICFTPDGKRFRVYLVVKGVQISFMSYDNINEAKEVASFARAYGHKSSEDHAKISQEKIPQWIKDKIDKRLKDKGIVLND